MSMFVIERSIMLASAAACASERRSMNGTPEPSGARPRAGTIGHLSLQTIGMIGSMENVVVGNIVLVLAVGERSATELVVVGNVVPFLVVRKQTTTPRVVVALVVPRGVVVDVPVVDVLREVPLPQDPKSEHSDAG